MPRFALVAQSFSGNSGTGRYARELLIRMGNQAISVEGESPFPSSPSLSYFSSFMSIYARWKSVEGRVKLVHLTNAYAPFALPEKASMTRISTWHDLFPLTYGGITDRLVFSLGLLNYSRSDGLLFNSEETRDKLFFYLKAHGIDADKPSKVVWPGVAAAFIDAEPRKGPRRDLAFVGVLHNKHKDMRGLLSTFEKIRKEREVKLHVFTSAYDASLVLKESVRMGLQGHVLVHVGVDDRGLADWLSRCSALLHVVRAEGFGIPILESLAVGTPVLLPLEADVPAVTARYATRGKLEELPDLAVKLIDEGKPAPPFATEYAKGFTWDKAVKETIDFYEELMS